MKKVITYGTYDLFHEGHYRLLKRAKELGDYLLYFISSAVTYVSAYIFIILLYSTISLQQIISSAAGSIYC